jgi:hypothetical protein
VHFNGVKTMVHTATTTTSDFTTSNSLILGSFGPPIPEDPRWSFQA